MLETLEKLEEKYLDWWLVRDIHGDVLLYNKKPIFDKNWYRGYNDHSSRVIYARGFTPFKNKFENYEKDKPIIVRDLLTKLKLEYMVRK